MNTNTQRTLEYLRGQGMRCAIVEHWNSFARVKQDLFGFIDILALDPHQHRVIGVQCCSDANRAAHKAKIQNAPAFLDWLDASGIVFLISWGKHGERGKAKRWQAHCEQIQVER